jgi:UDP-2,3-diacylglucosamine hydrolase
MSSTNIFISDIHLGLQKPETEKEKENKLVKLLDEVGSKADRLFILGDLFDYWFEYRRVIQKGFLKTLAGLQTLAEKGVEIHYIIGNHDFLHDNFFEDEIGCKKVYQDPFDITIEGKKFYLGHGDGLVKNDYGYLILKKILRNRFLQWFYSIIHPDFGIWLASSTSRQSREYTKAKDYGEVDGMFEEAKKKIDEGYDYVIFGHLHQRKFETHKQGTYINLGSWLDKPCYGIFKDNEFKIIDWN